MTATTAAPVPTPAVGSAGGSQFTRLLKAEYLKIRTTNVWWLLGLFTILAVGLALLVNILSFHLDLVKHGTPEEIVAGSAAIFTSGQFFGAMFALLLATLTITNEYHHQTVTTTFLATPHRTTVIMAKFVISMLAAGAFWLFTTIIDLIVGAIYFSASGNDSNIGDSKVIQAMLLSLMVFALWAVFGVGLGVLLRSQIGATVTGALLYTVGLYLAIGIFQLIHAFIIKEDWVLTAMVIVPAVAAQVAINPIEIYPEAPHQWVGAAVMIGYGLVFGAIGLYFTRKRDVS
jgi:ABC-2 type transport system permease protein